MDKIIEVPEHSCSDFASPREIEEIRRQQEQDEDEEQDDTGE
jgi:hypothetical protein